MSGTSADGVDAVLVQFRGNPKRPKWKLLNLTSISYSAGLRAKIIDAGQGFKFTCHELLGLAEEVTEIYAEAALNCDPQGKSQIIGCHGQTVCHRPPKNNHYGSTWQLLQAPLLAQIVNRPVIYDFRSADLALGGQGAPLVPLLDAALLGRVGGWRALLNLGGISNLTLIPPRSGPDRYSSVMGWDCGPANSLIDLAVEQFTSGEQIFDRDGLFAKRGSANIEIIKHWLKEPFFQELPPKSTGREIFGLQDLERRIKEASPSSKEDLIATLTTFTAAIIGQDLDNLYATQSIRPIELLVAGGGCRNHVMFSEIVKRCRGICVKNIQQIGIQLEARESLAFALLAWWHVLKYPGNSPAITGANRSGVLGIRVDPI